MRRQSIVPFSHPSRPVKRASALVVHPCQCPCPNATTLYDPVFVTLSSCRQHLVFRPRFTRIPLVSYVQHLVDLRARQLLLRVRRRRRRRRRGERPVRLHALGPQIRQARLADVDLLDARRTAPFLLLLRRDEGEEAAVRRDVRCGRALRLRDVVAVAGDVLPREGRLLPYRRVAVAVGHVGEEDFAAVRLVRAGDGRQAEGVVPRLFEEEADGVGIKHAAVHVVGVGALEAPVELLHVAQHRGAELDVPVQTAVADGFAGDCELGTAGTADHLGQGFAGECMRPPLWYHVRWSPSDVRGVDHARLCAAWSIRASQADVSNVLQCCDVDGADFGNDGLRLMPGVVVSVDEEDVFGQVVIMVDDVGEVRHRFSALIARHGVVGLVGGGSVHDISIDCEAAACQRVTRVQRKATHSSGTCASHRTSCPEYEASTSPFVCRRVRPGSVGRPTKELSVQAHTTSTANVISRRGLAYIATAMDETEAERVVQFVRSCRLDVMRCRRSLSERLGVDKRASARNAQYRVGGGRGDDCEARVLSDKVEYRDGSCQGELYDGTGAARTRKDIRRIQQSGTLGGEENCRE
ncbi:hypothetical protein MRB53_037340 [Persea americana]|nr:hypothetical protein MRB53_037340 [Persea americana]